MMPNGFKLRVNLVVVSLIDIQRECLALKRISPRARLDAMIARFSPDRSVLQ